MVVNRRQLVVPAPPISRSSSSQPVPTKRQTRVLYAINNAQDATPQNDPENNKSNPDDVSSMVISVKSAKKRKSKSWIDRLIFFTLSAFILYAFYTCRPNPLFPSSSLYTSEPTLCRALVTYRTHILEPYVLPPVTHTLSYTHKVSQPYIVKAKVNFAPYLRPVQKTLDAFSPYVETLTQTTRNLWKDTLKPYYKTAIVPRYRRYIYPLLIPVQIKAEKYFAHYVSNPICTKTNFVIRNLHQMYTRHVDLYVRLARPYVYRTSNKVNELTVRVFEAYNAYVRPFLFSTWIRTRPVISVALKRTKSLFIYVLEVTGSLLAKVTNDVCIYRRQYVDLHLIRIWEKVVNPGASGGRDKCTPPSTSTAADVLPVTGDFDAEGNLTAEVYFEPTLSPSSATTKAVPTMSETGIMTSEAESKTSTVETEFVNTRNIITPGTLTVNRVPASPKVEDSVPEDVQAALSVALESSDHASTVVQELEQEIQSKAGSEAPLTLATTVSSSTPTNQETSSKPEDLIVELPSFNENSDSMTETTINGELTSESETLADKEDDLDGLDDFLKEIGFGEASPSPTPSDDIDEIFNDTPVYTKTEEERLAETAAKRADIVGRHEKWFEKLHDSVARRGSELVKTLQILRDNAAEEVRRMSARSSGIAGINVEAISDDKSLNGAEKDGERLIKGLEGYLQKAEIRSSKWKVPKDSSKDDEARKAEQDIAFQEKDKFADIVSKVENKFSNRVSTIQHAIRSWYIDLKDREAAEVLSTAQLIKELASQAQEDLAMDYAWLDDVTYLDWQRYHDLMRIYDRFDETVRQIANGTSTNPMPPSDPVVEALNELNQELQDITLGFNFALSEIRSRGLKVFNLRPMAEAGDEDNGFFVVKDNERRVVDLRGADLGDIPLKEGTGRLVMKQEDLTEQKDGENDKVLPISDTHPPRDQTSGFDTSKIIIGKDKVQIEEALKDIPLEPSVLNHGEL